MLIILNTTALLLLFSRLQTCVCLKWQTATWRGGQTGCTGTAVLYAASRQPPGTPCHLHRLRSTPPAPRAAQGQSRLLASPRRCQQVASSPGRVRDRAEQERAETLPGLLLFLLFSPLVQQVPSLQSRLARSESGYRYQGMGKRDTSIDQCSWARNWGLRVKPSAGHRAHHGTGWDGLSSRGKAGVLPRSVSLWETLGKLAWLECGAGNSGPGSGWEWAAHRHRWLRCGCSPGRWCGWQISCQCLPRCRQPR